MKKISSYELKSNQRLIEVANYYKKYKTYPHHTTKLGSFLAVRRQAFKNYINKTNNNNRVSWHPSDIQIAKIHGLPDDWMLIRNHETKSNQKIIKIAKYYKKYKCYPDSQTKLGKFLSIRRQIYKNRNNKYKHAWHNSDLIIAKEHGLPDDWICTKNYEIESNQKIIEIANYFKKYNSYPNYNNPLGYFLARKRSIYKNKKSVWYISDEQIAKTHGLPHDWMIFNKSIESLSREQESNNLTIQLAHYFKKHNSYPEWKSKLGIFLNTRKKAFKDYTNNIKSKYKWYPSDEKIAKIHGLPHDWMHTRSREKESNNLIIKLAKYFTKHGTYPNQKSILGRFLSRRRQAFKDYTNNIKSKSAWYPSDAEIAKIHGLPDDWMHTVNREKESNELVIKLAQEFSKFKTYPSSKTILGCFLRIKRLAFRDYTLGKKTISSLWYPSDAEIAKIHGLPDDWMLFKKAKLSLGETKTKFILEKLKLKPIQQYKHKLCVNKLCLPFDFYIYKDNIHYFIEYNGEQHYRPVFGRKNFTKEEVFKKTQKNDLIKLNFCKQHNYPLLVIPYWINDNFEHLISEFLKTTSFNPKFAQPIMPSNP